eukprot:m.153830 g.153830  ORF g.153830 m.153830 type:complete len:507 (+) comp23472_c0_seq1:37-1557(+)
MPPKSTPKKTTGAGSKGTTPKKSTAGSVSSPAGARSTRTAGTRPASDTKAAVARARAKTAAKHATPAEAAQMKEDLAAHKKRLKEIKRKHAELKEEHEVLRDEHGVAKVSLEETAVKLNHLQKVHSKLKDQSDSHAGASVDSLTSYKDIVEDHSSKLGTAHDDLEETMNETLAMSKELSAVQAEIASLRKSNAALRAAVNDNELVADETDAALDRAVADCENAQLQLRTVEAELDEAVAEQETTSVELDICRQQLEELRDRGQKKAIESAGTESARTVELEHGRTLVDAMRVQLDGLRESQTAAESESGDLRVEAAEHDLKLQLLETDLASKSSTRDRVRETLSTQVGSMAEGSAELRNAEAQVRQLEEKLASYAAIEVELNERRAREKVSAGLKTRLEDQLQQLREEAKKLRESTVSAKTTVTETLKGKLSAVQAKNKVEEELAKTLEELRRLQGADSDSGGDNNEVEDAAAVDAANAQNNELKAELERLEETHARLSTEVGALG